MKIRAATPADAAVLDSLLTQLIRYEKQWNENIDETVVMRDNYIRLMEREECRLLAAEEDGEIVGYLCGLIAKQPTFRKPVALLDAVFVKPDYRGKGIGRALILRFRELAAEAGAAYLELKVFSENPARRLYSSLGFRERMQYMSMPL